MTLWHRSYFNYSETATVQNLICNSNGLITTVRYLVINFGFKNCTISMLKNPALMATKWNNWKGKVQWACEAIYKKIII